MKNALKSTAFDDFNDLLLKLYYLYEKVPKNCRELCEIVADLRECISMEIGSSQSKPVGQGG